MNNSISNNASSISSLNSRISSNSSSISSLASRITQLEKSGSPANIFENMSVRDTCSVELSTTSRINNYSEAENKGLNGTLDFVCTYSDSNIKYLLALNSSLTSFTSNYTYISWTAKVTYMNATRTYTATIPSKSDLETYTTETTRKRDTDYWTSTENELYSREKYYVTTSGTFKITSSNYNTPYPAIKITF